MKVGRLAAVNGMADRRVFGQLVFQIHNGFRTAYEQDGVPVIKLAHLVRGEQFSAGLLEICRVGAAPPLGLPVGFGIDGSFSESLGDVVVGAGLVPTKV